MASQFFDMMSSSNCFDFVLFLLSSLVTGPSFMSISLPVLELRQFSFIRDWPEIRKSEIHPSEFCSICGDWGELGIRNLAQIFLMKCYWILQNARVTAFIVSQLFKKNHHCEGHLKVPLTYCTNYFWYTFNKEKPLLSKRTCITTKRKYLPVLFKCLSFKIIELKQDILKV